MKVKFTGTNPWWILADLQSLLCVSALCLASLCHIYLLILRYLKKKNAQIYYPFQNFAYSVDFLEDLQNQWKLFYKQNR